MRRAEAKKGDSDDARSASISARPTRAPRWSRSRRGRSSPRPSSRGPQRAPETVAATWARSVRAVDPTNARVGVGIGFAGMLRGWSGVVVIAPNFGWREVDFRTMLRAQVGERCELYNDLERHRVRRGASTAARAACATCSASTSAPASARGIVVDGRLYAGATHLGRRDRPHQGDPRRPAVRLRHARLSRGVRVGAAHPEARARRAARRRALARGRARRRHRPRARRLPRRGGAPRRRLRRAPVGRGVDAARHGARRTRSRSSIRRGW